MGICTRGGSLKGGKFPHTKKAPFKLSQGGPSELDRRVQQQRLRRQNRENLPQKSLQNSPFKHRSNLHTTAHSRQWGQSTRLRLGCQIPQRGPGQWLSARQWPQNQQNQLEHQLWNWKLLSLPKQGKVRQRTKNHI